MSLVLWYDPIPFHFCILSIFALTLSYYDAQNQCDTSHELHESAQSHTCSMLIFVKSLLLAMPLFSNA